MAVNPSPFGPKPQFELSDGTPAVGNQLFFYVAGSVNTKQNTYTTSTGGVANANPIVLNSLGMPTTEIWFTQGQSYKVVYAPSTDTDPPTSPIWTIDNLKGINDTTGTVDQWVAFSGTPTFVSATSFTLVGDQTSTLEVGRRLKTTNSGGTIYSTITGSAFGALTTITVLNDSGVLDAGLSAVSYGLLSSSNASVPGLINIADIAVLTTAGTVRGASAPNVPVNFSLATTVAASALTISVKGRNGNDPSASNPVLIPFRSATSATGDYTWLVLTSATSLVISSGSTMGFTNAVLGRLWIVGFNDAGTFRLGAVNALSGTSIMPLRDDALASSTAEGGIGGADSAQVIYTGTAVTTKALRVLGYLEATEATAGTWATAPSKVQIFEPGVSLPGTVVQVQRTATGAVASGTTVIPYDDTIPQNTEGDQYMSQAITPTSAANVLTLEAQFQGDGTGAPNDMIVAFFQDTTASALFANATKMPTNNYEFFIRLYGRLLAATTSATTFKVRAGGSAAGTMGFNGVGSTSTRRLGGVMNSLIEVTEIVA